VFEDLYDSISKLFSRRWPTSEGIVTAIDIESVSSRHTAALRLAVSYQFSLDDDGPYTGESFWEPSSSARVLTAKDSLQVGQSVVVRYRPDDPSVNTLDRRFWWDF
jgi:hypothetical protein